MASRNLVLGERVGRDTRRLVPRAEGPSPSESVRGTFPSKMGEKVTLGMRWRLRPARRGAGKGPVRRWGGHFMWSPRPNLFLSRQCSFEDPLFSALAGHWLTGRPTPGERQGPD